MEDNDFLKRMENLKKPQVNADASKRQIKLALLNTTKSAAWGVWFLVIPIFFLSCVAVKYLLHWNWPMAGKFLDWMANIDKSMSFPVVTIFLFIILPAFGAIINLLSIVHFNYDRNAKEILATLKMKWPNIILAGASICILGIVLVYAIAENSAERAIRKYEIEWRSK